MSVAATAPAPLELYARGLEALAALAERPRAPMHAWAVRFEDGTALPLPLERFLGAPQPEEREILDRVPAPVLDVGCGPGRHVHALADAGIPALGIDVAPAALRLARERGGVVLHRSVFGEVPAAGWWGSALLLDGNVGIGGDPVELLRRVATLLRGDGQIFLELDGPGVRTHRCQARLEGPRESSAWFPWARVSVADLDDVASRAGLRAAETWQAGTRWFACLAR